MKKQWVGSVQEKTQGDLMKDRLKSVPKGYLCPTFFSFSFLMSTNEKSLVFPPLPSLIQSPIKTKTAGKKHRMSGRSAGLTCALLQLDVVAHVDVVYSDVSSGWMIEKTLKHHLDRFETNKAKIIVCSTTTTCAKATIIYCTRWCSFTIKAQKSKLLHFLT